jgi:hypothetical protein
MTISEAPTRRVGTELRRIRDSWSKAERERRRKLGERRRMMLLQMLSPTVNQHVA